MIIINNSFERKKYCSAAFLDISQAFDKVWHTELKSKLSLYIYNILKSDLDKRYFYVKVQDEQTKMYPINKGVPQGSVLGHVLYRGCAFHQNTEISTFADDTAQMASHKDHIVATRDLLNHINDVQSWLNPWRIKVNEQKSAHFTFALKQASMLSLD